MKTFLFDYVMTLPDGSTLIMNPYATHPCDLEDCHDGTHSHEFQYVLIGLTREQADQQVMQQDLSFIRRKRDKLLAESDWTEMPNSPLSEDTKLAWAAYRQALRDMPETYQLGVELVWPLKP